MVSLVDTSSELMRTSCLESASEISVRNIFHSNIFHSNIFCSVGANLPLVFAPENGNMLGGTRVNLTGPCFEPGTRVTCRSVFKIFNIFGKNFA